MRRLRRLIALAAFLAISTLGTLALPAQAAQADACFDWWLRSCENGQYGKAGAPGHQSMCGRWTTWRYC